jgi:hypothetical protein
MQLIIRYSVLFIAIILLAGLIIFSSTTSHTHAQTDSVNEIVAAYSDMAGWGSYTAQINEEQQLALVLASENQHYQLLESWQRSFQGTYQPPRRAAEGQLIKSFQQREYADIDPDMAPISEVELTMNFNILGLDGRIYAEGQQIVIPENEVQNIYFPALTRLPRDEVPGDILRFVDYNSFRVIDDLLMVLNNSHLVVGPLLLEESVYGENLTVYTLEIPPNAGISALRIEVDSIFASDHIAENIDRDAFYHVLGEAANLVLRVYLDQAGILVAEEIELNASLTTGASPINDDRFRYVLKFERQIFYQNINQAPAVQEP